MKRILLALLLSLPGLASAADDPADDGKGWSDRRVAVLGYTGVGTPVGMAGVGVDYSPARWLTLGGGVGYSEGGVQVALMPRLTVPVGRWVAIAFGAGISGGPFVDKDHFCWPDCGSRYPRRWGFAGWGNFDFGVEGRSRNGFAWRAFAGYGLLIDKESGVCTQSPTFMGSCGGAPTGVGYVGGAFGYAF